MVERRDWLLEIGTEELPPQALLGLSQAFARALEAQLAQQNFEHGPVTAFATPRRLGVLISDLASLQPDRDILRRGPSVRAAFDAQGNPTNAAQGFARSCGVNVASLERLTTEKGEWLAYRRREPGRALDELAEAITARALADLPIPKRMRWGDREDAFLRPVHWILSLFGDRVLPGRFFGISTGRETRGHRFHHPEPLALSEPDQYARRLREEGWVEPSFTQRRARIRDQVETCAREVGGLAVMEPALLDEVTALCEWPVALLGSFEARFLQIPPEVLMETMQKHQRYFPVRGETGALLPHFITVANLESRDPDQVRAGNERVIRPRFADAEFFWTQDRKRPLESYGPALQAVVFQEKLGSLAEKSRRVAQIAVHLAESLGLDPKPAARAAELAKCDLLTQMVQEFPSLQGIMGRYYAEHAGEEARVSRAIEEQYLPRHAGDRLPDSDYGRILSLAERLDTLLGIFAIGQRPTGVKDPYALRRAAIGLLRILIETPLSLDLRAILTFCAQTLEPRVPARSVIEDVLVYILDRLRGYYQDRGIRGDLVEAVLALGHTDPRDLDLRIQAVQAFLELPESQALSAANKRIRNLLRRAEQPIPNGVDPDRLEQEAEIQLAQRIDALGAVVNALIRDRAYAEALRKLASLGPDVDRFFEDVMVMVDDPAVRGNRLALLSQLEGLFLGVADIARLQGAQD